MVNFCVKEGRENTCQVFFFMLQSIFIPEPVERKKITFNFCN